MNFVIRFIVFVLDPIGVWRRLLIEPLFNLTVKNLDRLRNRAEEKVLNFKDFLLRFGLVAFAAVLIIWTAVFLYVAFYYTYMPSISHVRPVHLQFKTCLQTGSPCTFPNAHVALTKAQQLLMFGQAYKVLIVLEMPESQQNLDLGMFMVCAEMRDVESMLRAHSCRSTMMRYRSPLIRTMSTWALSPLYILGLKEEFQHVPVEIFSQYLEEQYHPITDVYIELQSQKIQFYRVALHIVADFTGLRYLMYNWPVLSAFVAISTNLFFLLIIFVLSWYNWSNTNWLRGVQNKYDEMSSSIKSKASKAIEASLQDDEELEFLDEKLNDSDIDDLSGDIKIGDKKEKLGISVEDFEKETLQQRKAK